MKCITKLLINELFQWHWKETNNSFINVRLWLFKWIHMYATAVVHTYCSNKSLPHIAMEIINYICIIGLWLLTNYCYIQKFNWKSSLLYVWDEIRLSKVKFEQKESSTLALLVYSHIYDVLIYGCDFTLKKIIAGNFAPSNK